MQTTRWIVLAFAGLLACRNGSPRPVEGRPDPGAGSAARPAADPADTLAALAAAARADDGAALDALIHPDHGLWLWSQPGAMVTPTQQLMAGDPRPPSERLDPDGFNPYWMESYWSLVVDGLDHALGHLDREPGDRGSLAYGDCSDDGEGQFRAWLAGADRLSATEVEMARDGGVRFAAAQIGDLIHLHAWGLDVYLARDRGRLWVVHVMVWTPCDA